MHGYGIEHGFAARFGFFRRIGAADGLYALLTVAGSAMHQFKITDAQLRKDDTARERLMLSIEDRRESARLTLPVAVTAPAEVT